MKAAYAERVKTGTEAVMLIVNSPSVVPRRPSRWENVRCTVLSSVLFFQDLLLVTQGPGEALENQTSQGK